VAPRVGVRRAIQVRVERVVGEPAVAETLGELQRNRGVGPMEPREDVFDAFDLLVGQASAEVSNVLDERPRWSSTRYS
jgi:hypothetical protein